MDISAIKEYVKKSAVPMCIVTPDDRIAVASESISKVFLFDALEGEGFYGLTGVKIIWDAEDDESLISKKIYRNDRIFSVEISPLTGDYANGAQVLFVDVTEAEALKEEFDNNKLTVMYLDVDNFDELMSSTEEEQRATLNQEIDKAIRSWCAKLKGSINRISSRKYCIYVTKGAVKKEMDEKFTLLTDVKNIATTAEFPITVSIGVGLDGETPEDDAKSARQALDMVKGRGGDQAVVMDGEKISYFGGTTQSVEKRNKGKSRVIGYALQSLIDNASKVLIMGHKNPDMDAFGAAVGISRLAKIRGKRSYIIVNGYTDALDLLMEKIKDNGEHEVITSERAMELLDENTVVVMVDTHRLSMVECPEAYEQATRKVVIDHHRKTSESYGTPTLYYMESYASSTAELVTEILQYTIDRKELPRIDAEALLSGIMVDTNFFSVKAGVRTYEAAAWLKRAGANSEDVKKFFQVRPEIFKSKADCYKDVEISENGIAYAVYTGNSFNAQIINSQVADELLTVRGVKASFVASIGIGGKTYVSARSLGEVNVQLIMEHFGGGGHLNTAGAQMELIPEAAIEEIRKVAERNNDDADAEA